jgi:hypothetical protein
MLVHGEAIWTTEIRPTSAQQAAGELLDALPEGRIADLSSLLVDEWRADTILAALCTFPNHDAEAVKGILRDFARAMQTRMREQVKVATCRTRHSGQSWRRNWPIPVPAHFLLYMQGRGSPMPFDNKEARAIAFEGFDDVQLKLVAATKAFKQAPSEKEGPDALAAFVKDILAMYIDGWKDALLRRVIPEVHGLSKRVADLEKAHPTAG